MPPISVQPSSEYQVTINVKEIFVYDSSVPASYCSFEMVGLVAIVIKTRRDLKCVDIRPLPARVIKNTCR